MIIWLHIQYASKLTTRFESDVNSAEQTLPMCPVRVCYCWRTKDEFDASVTFTTDWRFTLILPVVKSHIRVELSMQEPRSSSSVSLKSTEVRVCSDPDRVCVRVPCIDIAIKRVLVMGSNGWIQLTLSHVVYSNLSVATTYCIQISCWRAFDAVYFTVRYILKDESALK